MNKQDYEAAYVSSLSTANPLPSFSNVVEKYTKAHRGERLKREDIVTAVALLTGCSVDESISWSINIELARLTKKNIVRPGRQHGYWEVCN